MTASTHAAPSTSVSDPKLLVVPPGSIATPFSTMTFALLSDDWITVDAALSDDVEWNMMPNAQILKGKSGVLAFMKAAFYSAQRTPDVIGSQGAGDWGVFEYWNIGTITEHLVAFAKASGWAFPNPEKLAGRTYKVAVCFVWHVNPKGKIDLVGNTRTWEA
jgi:hypothetical protein